MTWLGRLKAEARELDAKVELLRDALEAGDLPEESVPLLEIQLCAMVTYQEILILRIAQEE